MANGIAKWRTTWPCLSPARRAVYATFNVLILVSTLGVVAGVALVLARLSSLPVVLVASALALAVTFWELVVDPLLPEDTSDRPLSATVVHQVASVLALAILPWVLVAGQLGADLRTGPELHAQVVQVIPVLLLAALFERRFFPSAPDRLVEDRTVLRFGFVFLVAGPCLGEVFALLALATHAGWVEVTATVLSAAAIPSLLVLIAGPVLVALYEPRPAG